MSTQILMPALSPTMTEGKLARWLKKVGDDVRAGDVIAEIETDKATMEVEAVDEGKLAQILIDEGAEGVAVNTPIAVLAADGEDASPPPATHDAAAEPKVAAAAEAVNAAARPSTAAAAPVSSASSAPDKDWGPTKPTTVREALRDAMARRDARRRPRVPAGRGGRAISGRVQDQPRLARRVRPAPHHRHADHRARFHRHGGRCGDERPQADRRVHDVQLCDAGRSTRSSTRRPRRCICRAARWAVRSCSAGRTVQRHASRPSTANAMRVGMRIARG